ncbi:MAG: cob(I)yrinic acid a,c-diamide adenosyltransferase [Candidatus Eutrophobiaceae bacterium]
MTDGQTQHREEMQRQQRKVRARIAAARQSKGLIIYLYGAGKGKSSSAFGTLLRCLGHGKRGGVVQFIKGKWKTGEQKFLQSHADVEYCAMNSGFTWDTQDREADIACAEEVWVRAAAMLADASLSIVVLDEIAWMLEYGYFDAARVVAALQNRVSGQHVILTGRPEVSCLLDIADTSSEVREIKHAFNAGIKAQKGIEW